VDRFTSISGCSSAAAVGIDGADEADIALYRVRVGAARVCVRACSRACLRACLAVAQRRIATKVWARIVQIEDYFKHTIRYDFYIMERILLITRHNSVSRRVSNDVYFRRANSIDDMCHLRSTRSYSEKLVRCLPHRRYDHEARLASESIKRIVPNA
jgi:hypothetical protein